MDACAGWFLFFYLSFLFFTAQIFYAFDLYKKQKVIT